MAIEVYDKEKAMEVLKSTSNILQNNNHIKNFKNIILQNFALVSNPKGVRHYDYLSKESSWMSLKEFEGKFLPKHIKAVLFNIEIDEIEYETMRQQDDEYVKNECVNTETQRDHKKFRKEEKKNPPDHGSYSISYLKTRIMYDWFLHDNKHIYTQVVRPDANLTFVENGFEYINIYHKDVYDINKKFTDFPKEIIQCVYKILECMIESWVSNVFDDFLYVFKWLINTKNGVKMQNAVLALINKDNTSKDPILDFILEYVFGNGQSMLVNDINEIKKNNVKMLGKSLMVIKDASCNVKDIKNLIIKNKLSFTGDENDSEMIENITNVIISVNKLKNDSNLMKMIQK